MRPRILPPPSSFSPRARRPAWLRWLGPCLLLLWGARPAVAQLAHYSPCLGCAEHTEIRTRWHRPFLTELAGESFLIFDHFRLEQDAANMGLCESDPLLQGRLIAPGCHRYSSLQAWLLETPLELVAFTSPAWGLARRGHPRWAMALELLPAVYHALSIRATVEAIHQWQREQYLYH